MLVTLVGITKSVKLLNPAKALFPILVTLDGIIMLVKLIKPSKAEP